MVPGIAPAAIQEGRHAAANIVRAVRGQPRLPFRYRDKGTLATIGRAAAVADLRGIHLKGLIAWLAWLVVHIYFLIGFRNRLLVLLEWAWAYVANERGARLITEPVRAVPPSETSPCPPMQTEVAGADGRQRAGATSRGNP